MKTLKGTLAELSTWLGVSVKAISELQGTDRLPRWGRGDIPLKEAVVAYCKILREAAAGRSGAGGEAGLADQRSRLAAEQADKAAMENAARRRELLPVEEVNEAVTSAFARVRARLLAIPSKAAPRVHALGTAAEAQAVLTELVHEALEELADTRTVALLADADRGSDGGSGTGLVAGDEAAAPADGERVGGPRKTAQR